jgi:hypothetical protein
MVRALSFGIHQPSHALEGVSFIFHPRRKTHPSCVTATSRVYSKSHESASDNAALSSKQAWSNTAPQLVDERDYNSFFVVGQVLVASSFSIKLSTDQMRGVVLHSYACAKKL